MEELLSKDDFKLQYNRLVKWFRVPMTHEQANMTYSRVSDLPIQGFITAIDYFIENGKPTPGQFPTTKEVVNQVYQWLDANPEEKFKRTRFDRIEDLDYPIKKLWDGFQVLTAQGVDAFVKFANYNRMPENDQERVVNKLRMVNQKDRDINNLTNGIGRE